MKDSFHEDMSTAEWDGAKEAINRKVKFGPEVVRFASLFFFGHHVLKFSTGDEVDSVCQGPPLASIPSF